MNERESMLAHPRMLSTYTPSCARRRTLASSNGEYTIWWPIFSPRSTSAAAATASATCFGADPSIGRPASYAASAALVVIFRDARFSAMERLSSRTFWRLNSGFVPGVSETSSATASSAGSDTTGFATPVLARLTPKPPCISGYTSPSPSRLASADARTARNRP